MSDLQGMVRAVVTSEQGGVAVSWVGNTLTVTDGADFPRDGGQFIVEGDPATVYSYSLVTDGATEDDPDTITTVDPAPAGLPTGDELRLTLWPAAVSSVAEVALPESTEDTVPAIIPHALKPYLPDGVRDPEDQEAVIIGQRDMAWVVVDILDQREVVMADVVQAVDDARDEAMEAHGLASEATTTAQDAHNAAVAAQDTAAAAVTAAGTAQTTATNAAQAAADAMTSANGRNSRVTSTSAPSGSVNPNTGNAWVDGDTWWQWDSTTTRNVIGAWTRRAGAWQAEAIGHQTIASVDTNKLVVTGSAYMAQAVVDKIVGDAAYYKLFTADRIQLQAVGASLYYDGNFSDPGLSALRASNSPTWTYNSTAQSMTGTGTFWLTYNAQDEALTVPLVVGQKYRAKVWGTGLTSAAKTFARRDNGGYTQLAGTTYGSGYMEVVFDVPTAGARLSVYPKTTASATITRVELAPLVGGTLIEPDGIDTPHLKATAIDGMTVTGATVQTVATANRGVKIDTAGFRAYDDSGNLTVQLAGSGGLIKGLNVEGGTVTGATVRTNSTGTRAQLVNNAVSWYSDGMLIAELFQVGNGLRMLAGETGYQSDITVSKDVNITSDQHIRLRPTTMNKQFGSGRIVVEYDVPVSQWATAEPLFLDGNGTLNKWGNAPQRPVVANGTVPAGTSIAPGNFYDLYLYYSVTRTPNAVLSDISSFPGGSGYLTTRVVSWSASSCLVRVVNTGTSTHTVPSGGMSVRAVVLV